jgi:hypothetical protein
MTLAPQDSGTVELSDVSRQNEAQRYEEFPAESGQTGRDPGRVEPAQVPLGHGVFALIDADDFERINAFKWHAKRKSSQPGRLYAQRTVRLTSGRDGKKTAVTLHREVMCALPHEVIDHRNGNGLDNRKENLRRTDARGNATNVTSSKNHKRGGWKGVSWNPTAGKWQAAICAGEVKANGKRRQLYLGCFDDPIAAARVYDAAARKHFGEFAACNLPEETPRELTAAAEALGGGR